MNAAEWIGALAAEARFAIPRSRSTTTKIQIHRTVKADFLDSLRVALAYLDSDRQAEKNALTRRVPRPMRSETELAAEAIISLKK